MTIVPYKVDTGSHGNIMPLHIYKKLFPRINNEKLAPTKNESIQLKAYNKTTITQLCTCTVEIEYKNKKKMCTFCVVPGNRKALLDMPDIDVLNIINIHSTGTEQGGSNDNCYKTAAQSADMM